jgi:4-hydroxy-tetrahydrodipicolinate reductase
MTKIVLCGIAGRMGREIIKAADDADDVEICAGVEAPKHPSIGEVINGITVTDDIAAVIENCDCVVDFTCHTATVDTLARIKQYKKPFVTGTTGFTEQELQMIHAVSTHIPLFWAPNMSVGVNHLYRLVESSLGILCDFDIEVVETHHGAKKDAPSGTAKRIASIIKEKRSDIEFVHGRQGTTGERKKQEVGIHALRGGDVVGEHRILFLGAGEFLELRHYATSRRCFAMGALVAVRYIKDKPPGLYTMEHLVR